MRTSSKLSRSVVPSLVDTVGSAPYLTLAALARRCTSWALFSGCFLRLTLFFLNAIYL